LIILSVESIEIITHSLSKRKKYIKKEKDSPYPLLFQKEKTFYFKKNFN